MTQQIGSINEKMMKIGQLSTVSGTTRSSIHHYLNMGLLPKPVTSGLNVHLYDQTHLALLKEIKRLREEEGVSLAEIKERLKSAERFADPDQQAARETGDAMADPLARDAPKGSVEKKAQILEKATDLFSRIGYEGVRISDITDALHMSKATFYEYFQGKEQLFIECIERLVVRIVPREGWRTIGEEKNYFKRQKLRARLFLEAFPGYSGILQQARIFSRANHQEMAAKAKETFHIMTRPIKRDIEKAQSQGAIREFDPELGAHMALGLAEGLGWKMMVDPGLDIERMLESITDLLKFGLLPIKESNQNTASPPQIHAHIVDIQGVQTAISRPTFDGRDFLEARVGEATVKIDPAQTKSLVVDPLKTDSLKLSVTSHGDQIMSVMIPLDLTMVGQTPFGEFRIPLEKVAEIKFMDQSFSMNP